MFFIKLKKGIVIAFTIVLFFVIGFFLFFRGKTDLSLKKQVDFCIDNEANVMINSFNLECKISRTLEGVTDIVLKSPETLKDIKFSWLGDDKEIAFEKIINKNKEDVLPISSFPASVFKILNHASKIEEKYGKISSTVEGINYTLEIDDNGKIKSIEAPSINLQVNFK